MDCDKKHKDSTYGEWSSIGADKRGQGAIYLCSNCNKTFPYKTHYCPNCGKMMNIGGNEK